MEGAAMDSTATTAARRAVDTEDATTRISEALQAQGISVHWVNNTEDTLKVTLEDGTVATVTIEV
jgi:hypothetical protein